MTRDGLNEERRFLRHGLAEVAAFKGGEWECLAHTAVCVEKDEQTGRPKAAAIADGAHGAMRAHVSRGTQAPEVRAGVYGFGG